MRVSSDTYRSHGGCVSQSLAEAPAAIETALGSTRPTDAESFKSSFVRAASETSQPGLQNGNLFVGYRNFGVFAALLDSFDAGRLSAQVCGDAVTLKIDGQALSIGATVCTSDPIRHYAATRGFLVG